MRKEPVSLKDIAKELNVSISTVSRALSNKGEINPLTRKAIIDLAEKWNYHPNPLATGLLKKKTTTIGVIIPEIENHYFSTILRGMDAIAAASGYRLIASYTNDLQKSEVQAIQELLLSRVEGIIACPAVELTDCLHYQQLLDDNIPLVIFERDCDAIETYQIITNNFKASYEVTEHMINKGCRRIGFITNLEPLSVGRMQYEGYLDALRKYCIPIDNELIIHGSMNISTSLEATKNLLSKNPMPDAIICCSDSVAMVAMRTVKEFGLSVPEDVKIAGFADEPFSSFLEPSLTTVGQPSYLIGMKSMEVMLEMIQGQRKLNSYETIILESALVIRESTRKTK